MHIRTAETNDLSGITELYRAVARQENGIVRSDAEITSEYVADFLQKSIDKGLILVAEHPEIPGQFVAEVHAYRPGPAVFNHIYSNLSIAVHPDFQGRKIGRTIFTIFLEEIGLHRRDIGRVELVTRESNVRAIALYESLGFAVEGRMEMRVKTPDGYYEADIPMAWQNPHFRFD